jgi:hypothetical protein
MTDCTCDLYGPATCPTCQRDWAKDKAQTIVAGMAGDETEAAAALLLLEMELRRERQALHRMSRPSFNTTGILAAIMDRYHIGLTDALRLAVDQYAVKLTWRPAACARLLGEDWVTQAAPIGDETPGVILAGGICDTVTSNGQGGTR